MPKAAISLSIKTPICPKCGRQYSRTKGYFSVIWTPMNKNSGHLPICNDCVTVMFEKYLRECEDEKAAVRQMCRKLDMYWSEHVYDMVVKKSSPRSVIFKYITKTNTSAYIGKCYDNTLEEEGTMWSFAPNVVEKKELDTNEVEDQAEDQDTDYDVDNETITIDVDDDFEVTDDIVKFWGGGNTRSEYYELEQKRSGWMEKLGWGDNVDAGAEALIRQICQLEIDINRGRIAGKTVDKQVATLNTLLGSANLKPTQKTETNSADNNTPYGVWVRRFENERPIPEPDPDFQDVDGIIRYISTWFFGHLCKMLGIKNSYSKLYESEIARLRVERPEYEDEDDDSMIYDIFGNDDEEG